MSKQDQLLTIQRVCRERYGLISSIIIVYSLTGVAPNLEACRATMDGMIYTIFFQCDRCHVECQVDSESPDDTPQFIIRHCTESEGISVLGKVTRFQERRGGLWVDVQRWIDAA